MVHAVREQNTHNKKQIF